MIFKIICLILLFILIVYVGYGILSYYKKRRQFYEDLINFVNYLNTEIAFLKTDLISLVENNCDKYHREMNCALQNYLKILKYGKGVVQNKISILKDDENLELDNFFNSLGKTNLQEQQVCIAHYKERFSQQKLATEQEIDKKGSVYFKLCIVLGLGVCIVLI